LHHPGRRVRHTPQAKGWRRRLIPQIVYVRYGGHSGAAGARDQHAAPLYMLAAADRHRVGPWPYPSRTVRDRCWPD
jgi:hypothetical protein